MLSTRGAQRTAHELRRGSYDVTAVVAATLSGLERSMRRNPPELIIETVLESYRHEHRVPAGEVLPGQAPLIFGDLFDRAVADGMLPGHVDAARLARLAQSMVSEGARHWAAGAYAPRSFADVVAEDIAALIAGFSRPPTG